MKNHNIPETISKNGLSYFTIEGNSKSNKIYIFLPGFGAYKENYISYISFFKDDYNHLYILDLPLQGSKGNGSIDSIIENIAEFSRIIVNKTISIIDIGGHSLGALSVLKLISGKYVIPNATSNKLKIDLLLSKTRYVILYALVPDFKETIGIKTIEFFRGIPCYISFIILNTIINIPQKVFSYFTINKYFKFSINRNNTPQYFGAVIKDFKLYLNNIESSEEFISNLTNDYPYSNKIKILTQIGTLDWLVKPWNKKRKRILETITKNENHKLIFVENLGHFLTTKFNLDINMNKQILLNKDIVQNTKKLIKYDLPF